MKYKIDNKISKRNIRKQGKNILPLMQKPFSDGVNNEIRNIKDDAKRIGADTTRSGKNIIFS